MIITSEKNYLRLRYIIAGYGVLAFAALMGDYFTMPGLRDYREFLFVVMLVWHMCSYASVIVITQHLQKRRGTIVWSHLFQWGCVLVLAIGTYVMKDLLEYPTLLGVNVSLGLLYAIAQGRVSEERLRKFFRLMILSQVVVVGIILIGLLVDLSVRQVMGLITVWMSPYCFSLVNRSKGVR